MTAPATSAAFSILRLLVCGSVDDGKSTLIGRLLYEAGRIPEDELAKVAKLSRRRGVPDGSLDFSLLTDGLEAEREQGITIDVAYRAFATPRRRFLLADAPGHGQYTSNMATAASTADAALLLVDARLGLLEQTYRHARIAALFGVRQFVLAVNKMDLVDYDEATFGAITEAFRSLVEGLGGDPVAIPVSALRGVNVSTRAEAEMPWYQGPSLLEHLETFPFAAGEDTASFALPVQLVLRDPANSRVLAGRAVSQAEAAPGQIVRILPRGQQATVARVFEPPGQPSRTRSPSRALALAEHIDVGRGDVVVSVPTDLAVANQFRATLLWLDLAPLLAGRRYELKIHSASALATVDTIRNRIDVTTGAALATTSIEANEIAHVDVSLDKEVAFRPYAESRDLGAFLLVERETARTVAAGVIEYDLRRAHNVYYLHTSVDAAARAKLKRQQPLCLWFTGLSGAGKSTIADLVERRLHASGRHTYLLDGDNVRHGLNHDLGFTAADRVENVRRVAEVARLMADAGLIVLVSLISPYRADRAFARSLFREGEFAEVFVDTPLETCAERDPKGLYGKARRGEIPNFTGLTSPYEQPERPEITLDTNRLDPQACAEEVVRFAESFERNRG